MEDLARVERLIEILLLDHPEHAFLVRQYGRGYRERRKLLQGLMALRPAGPLSEEFLRLEGSLLDEEREESELIDILSLPASVFPKITHFHGDMLRLRADCYVNEASLELQGCFVPEHRSLDARIHSASGLELRNACKRFADQVSSVGPGLVWITEGYHLAAKRVVHAVPPSVRGRLRDIDARDLSLTYERALRLAEKNGMRTVAIPCLSTGEKGFPRKDACGIAIDTVLEEISSSKDAPIVCFVTEKEEDRALYEERLGV